MRAPTPRIVSETAGPTRFNVGLNQPEEVKVKLEKMMYKRGNYSWRIPREEIMIESLEKVGQLMQQKSEGSQAIIGGTR